MLALVAPMTDMPEPQPVVMDGSWKFRLARRTVLFLTTMLRVTPTRPSPTAMPVWPTLRMSLPMTLKFRVPRPAIMMPWMLGADRSWMRFLMKLTWLPP